jgi:Asp-tRNA(Asn)/Glu-tRNA(Gln) amidotransferase A subunit family amidase
MLDVPIRSARQLAREIQSKRIACLDLLDLYLARVEKYDGALDRSPRLSACPHARPQRRPRALAPSAIGKRSHRSPLWHQQHHPSIDQTLVGYSVAVELPDVGLRISANR